MRSAIVVSALLLSGCAQYFAQRYDSTSADIVQLRPVEGDAQLSCGAAHCDAVTLQRWTNQKGSRNLFWGLVVGEGVAAAGLAAGGAFALSTETPTTMTQGSFTYQVDANHTLSGTLFATGAAMGAVALYDLFLNARDGGIKETFRSTPDEMVNVPLSVSWNGRATEVVLTDLPARTNPTFSVQAIFARRDEAAEAQARALAEEAAKVAQAKAQAEEWERGRPAREAAAKEAEKKAERERKAREAAFQKKQKARESMLSGAIEMSADTLLGMYRVNEVGADERFKGRRLAVTGAIASIDKTIFDIAVIRLYGDGVFSSVNCYLGRTVQKEVAGLVPGQRATVLGTLNGMTLGSPVLSDCKLFEFW